MNRKGFTLVELLATLVILSIIGGISLVVMTGNFGNAKDKSEDVFVKTVEDAINVYLDSDGKSETYGTSHVCQLSKTHGKVNVYKTSISIKMSDIINSTYKPITESEFTNPVNNTKCDPDTVINIYRDDDYIYYYKYSGNMGCLNKDVIIGTLPDGCGSE